LHVAAGEVFALARIASRLNYNSGKYIQLFANGIRRIIAMNLSGRELALFLLILTGAESGTGQVVLNTGRLMKELNLKKSAYYAARKKLFESNLLLQRDENISINPWYAWVGPQQNLKEARKKSNL
jgi:hypothetical protein